MLNLFKTKSAASLVTILTLIFAASGCSSSIRKEQENNYSICAIIPPLPEDDKVKDDIEKISDLTFVWVKNVATVRECFCKESLQQKQECFKKFEELENAKIQ